MKMCTNLEVGLVLILYIWIPDIYSRGTRTASASKWGWPQEVQESQSHSYEYTESSDDTFDLIRNPATCVQHYPYHANQDTQHIHHNQQTKPFLTFILPEDSECFQIFESTSCNQHENEMERAYIQLFNVKSGRKTVGLNSHQDRLLNFNTFPNSFQLCDRDESERKQLHAGHCKSQFRMEIKGTLTKTLGINNDSCVPIPKSTKNSQYNRPQAELNIVLNNPTKMETICLDLFSRHDCTGDIVRFVVPPSSVLWNKEQDTVKIWEYFSDKMGNPVVDIDVNSVRKCSYCLKEDVEDDILLSNYAAVSSQIKPPLVTSVHSQLESTDPAQCKFNNCTSISSLLHNASVELNFNTNKNCYFYFNDTACSNQPSIREEHMNITTLRQIAKRHPSFRAWYVVHCEDLRRGEINEKCTSPSSPDGIEDVFKKKPHHHDKGLFKPWEKIVLSVAGGLAVIMLIIVIIMSILLWRKKRRIRTMRQRCVPNKRQGHHHQQRNVHQIDGIEENDYVNDITGLRAVCESFADRYEIPRDRINIGNIRDSTACIIGVGEFSVAFKGRLEPEGKTVAVKTMKSGQATTRSIKGALRECQIFRQLGDHPGILELLGVCTENVRKGEVFIVMAWCAKGSLRGFLAQQKSHFVSLVQDGEWVNDEKLQNALEAKSFIENGPPVKFNTIQLFKWCVEVADAMEFLTVRKIVHVSLSARNVLLDEKFICKISDFHLAKVPGDVIPIGSFSTMNRNLNKERLVPWRWYAVESLLDDVFSAQSDVWTYGVFMWEVFSLGATPYPEYTYGSEFTLCIKHGYRLQTPNFATVECYQLMIMCWYDAPEKRPSFTKLKSKLEEMTPKKNTPITPGPFQVIRTLSK